MVFRANKVNLFYIRVESETIAHLAYGLDILTKWGYVFKSITLDGRKGFIAYVKDNYPNVAIQYCQFHQKQTIKQQS
jgi:hypothetical protein